MINQLRVYRIDPQAREAFHARFRDHAARLMRAQGFRILAMWEEDRRPRGEDELNFVYLLAWEDEAEMDAKWAAFMALEEWAEIKRRTSAEHGPMVLGNFDRTLVPVEYSAALER
ncbi:NIPSNAP family protein [Albimonas sp. CAU 1670]|uniref:NIPSNAP family protein n=1 Tax=Albimonas sp. CAU 1670 TaxID=3032599 RepID=UPI0023DBE0AC|nr:NIPSNAP family protein [Albimonas sp. CAU 1670]MDF2232046.1 NIPSNAP family protein [Albimonas sp. CAU 1670]